MKACYFFPTNHANKGKYSFFNYIFNILFHILLSISYKIVTCTQYTYIISALKLLSRPENVPAMINCAHGKDRTGLVSAMVLACVGKSKEYIAYDYARSEVNTMTMPDQRYILWLYQIRGIYYDYTMSEVNTEYYDYARLFQR